MARVSNARVAATTWAVTLLALVPARRGFSRVAGAARWPLSTADAGPGHHRAHPEPASQEQARAGLWALKTGLARSRGGRGGRGEHFLPPAPLQPLGLLPKVDSVPDLAQASHLLTPTNSVVSSFI